MVGEGGAPISGLESKRKKNQYRSSRGGNMGQRREEEHGTVSKIFKGEGNWDIESRGILVSQQVPI